MKDEQAIKADTEWIVDLIENAQSLDRLNFLAELVRDCKTDGEKWTTDGRSVERARETWLKRQNELKGNTSHEQT